MKDTYTAQAITEMHSTAAKELPLLCLEISHADLAQPVRVVRDSQDLVHNGNTFQALGFRSKLPDQKERGAPRAQLAIDNIGKELTTWIETSGGGKGATVRMLQVLRSDPDTVQWEQILDLTRVAMDRREVTGQLGFDTFLDTPAVSYRYTPKSAPGLYT